MSWCVILQFCMMQPCQCYKPHDRMQHEEVSTASKHLIPAHSAATSSGPFAAKKGARPGWLLRGRAAMYDSMALQSRFRSSPDGMPNCYIKRAAGAVFAALAQNIFWH